MSLPMIAGAAASAVVMATVGSRIAKAATHLSTPDDARFLKGAYVGGGAVCGAALGATLGMVSRVGPAVALGAVLGEVAGIAVSTWSFLWGAIDYKDFLTSHTACIAGVRSIPFTAVGACLGGGIAKIASYAIGAIATFFATRAICICKCP